MIMIDVRPTTRHAWETSILMSRSIVRSNHKINFVYHNKRCIGIQKCLQGCVAIKKNRRLSSWCNVRSIFLFKHRLSFSSNDNKKHVLQ